MDFPPPFAFLFGLIFGSFANVLIVRLPLEETVVRTRSHCPHCRALIPWHDNIPLLSWCLLLGRCRACRAPISLRYPFVELLAGIAFLATARLYDAGAAVAAAAVLWALIVIVFTDIAHRIIPNEISLTFAVLGPLLAAGFSLGPEFAFLFDFPLLPRVFVETPAGAAVARSLAGLLLGGGVIWLIRIVGGIAYGREAMGLGDVKLMAFIGAWLGPGGAMTTIFAGVLAGGLVSIGLLLFRLAGRKSYIPFGPYLAFGAVLTILAPERIAGLFFPGLFLP